MFLKFKCIKNYFHFYFCFSPSLFEKLPNFLIIFYVTLIALLKFKHADDFLLYLEKLNIDKTAWMFFMQYLPPGHCSHFKCAQSSLALLILAVDAFSRFSKAFLPWEQNWFLASGNCTSLPPKFSPNVPACSFL